MSSGLVLDTGELGYLHDYSRNHHTLTNHGATPVRGKFGKGMLFDGVNDYIDCGNDASLNITDAITIEAWMKRSMSGTKEGIVFKLYAAGGTRQGYWFRILDTNLLRLEFGRADSDSQETFSSVGTINTEWHHVVATRNDDGVDAIINLFIDGRLDSTHTSNYPWGHHIKPALEIGDDWGSHSFNGHMASIKIYNRALSADEIKIAYLTKGYTSPLQKSPMGIE